MSLNHFRYPKMALYIKVSRNYSFQIVNLLFLFWLTFYWFFASKGRFVPINGHRLKVRSMKYFDYPFFTDTQMDFGRTIIRYLRESFSSNPQAFIRFLKDKAVWRIATATMGLLRETVSMPSLTSDKLKKTVSVLAHKLLLPGLTRDIYSPYPCWGTPEVSSEMKLKWMC